MSLKNKTIKAYQAQINLVPMAKSAPSLPKVDQEQSQILRNTWQEIDAEYSKWYEPKPLPKKSQQYYRQRNLWLLDGTFYVVLMAFTLYGIIRLALW
jgi:hypothetical protein